MKRIALLGCGGSGKSTLARAIGRALSLPVHHLDTIYWRPGWVVAERDEFERRQRELVASDAWVVDGNYGSTLDIRLARADTVVLLDLDTWTCLRGILSRRIRFRRGSRPDMTPGNDERLTWEFLVYVMTFRRQRRPALLARLEALPPNVDVVVLASREETHRWLERVSARTTSGR